jgi:hypothetical protein
MMRAVVTWPPGLQSVCDHHHGILAWVSVIFLLAIRAAQDEDSIIYVAASVAMGLAQNLCPLLLATAQMRPSAS